MRTASAGALLAKLIVPQRNNSIPHPVTGGEEEGKTLTRNAIKRRCNYTADMSTVQSMAHGYV
jgi:hypothetical protein